MVSRNPSPSKAGQITVTDNPRLTKHTPHVEHGGRIDRSHFQLDIGRNMHAQIR